MLHILDAVLRMVESVSLMLATVMLVDALLCHSERGEESPTRLLAIDVDSCRLRGDPSTTLR